MAVALPVSTAILKKCLSSDVVFFGNNTPSSVDTPAFVFPDASALVEAYWQKALQCQTPEAMSAFMDEEYLSKGLCDAFESQYDSQNKNGKMFIDLLTHELNGQGALIRHALWNLDETPLSLQEAQKLMRQCLDGMVETVETYKGFYEKKMMTTQSSFGQVFTQAIERVKPLAAQKQIQLVVENTLSADAKIHVSDFRSDAMVWNLVQNAVKYSPVGSVVRVCLTPHESLKGPGLQLKVTDSGIGILPEEQENVLMGYRGKNAEAAGIPGTGFGLSEVEKHVRYAHGTLSIQSPVNPDNLQYPGTCITVSLPLAKN
jgi:signal transduction histidine kinase